MAQETMQFAENGVNLFDLLAKTTGKTVTQLLAMRETGQITFDMVNTALVSATSKGGTFYKALEKGNETFYGQMGQLTKSIQVLGRMLGEMILPQLKQIVEQVNKLLQLFIEMPNKMKFISEVLIAGIDVAIAYIEQEWKQLLGRMTKYTIDFAQNGLEDLTSPIWMMMDAVITGFNNLNSGAGANLGASSLDEATKRLQGILGRMTPQGILMEKFKADPIATINEELKKAADKAKAMFRDLGLGNMFKRDTTASIGNFIENMQGNGQVIVNALNTWIGGKITRAAVALTPLLNPREIAAPKGQRMQFAGAVQQGTADAYAAIAAALRQDLDPQVEATKEQTKTLLEPLELIANSVKNSVPFKLVTTLLD